MSYAASTLCGAVLPRLCIVLCGECESKLGRPADALALGGDEGRDKLR